MHLGCSPTCTKALSIWLKCFEFTSFLSWLAFRCLSLHSTEESKVSSRCAGDHSKVDQPSAGLDKHEFSIRVVHQKKVSLNPRRHMDCGSSFFRLDGSVSFPWFGGPGSSLGAALISRADDRVTHPRFCLERGVGRIWSQGHVANTSVLLGLLVCVNAFVASCRGKNVAMEWMKDRAPLLDSIDEAIERLNYAEIRKCWRLTYGAELIWTQ